MEEAAGLAPMMKLMLGWVGSLSKAFYEKYGMEAIPTITEVMSKNGVEWGKMTTEMAPAKSMKGVGELYKMIAPMTGMEMEIIELTDDTFHMKGPECALCIEGTSKELCEAIMTYDRKMISTLLGQEVELKILKSLAAGDNECEVVYSKK